MIDPEQQRHFALDVVRQLRTAGFEAYWAGGCVRDELLGRKPKDYDVATNATPPEIRALFGHQRTLPLGVVFGVITVLGPRLAGMIEVATFRQDAEYSDGRHPDRVTFSSAREDAARRDFTINGMFFEPVGGKVIDFVGGQADLQNRLIRAIGSPRLRFGEDKLRMLRAVRFTAALGFSLDAETAATVREMAGQITVVSPERIAMEMRRVLTESGRVHGIRLLVELGLAAAVLPEIVPCNESSHAGAERRWRRWGDCKARASPWLWRPSWPRRPMPRWCETWASAGNYRIRRPTKRPGWWSIARRSSEPACIDGRSCSPCSRIPGPSRWWPCTRRRRPKARTKRRTAANCWLNRARSSTRRRCCPATTSAGSISSPGPSSRRSCKLFAMRSLTKRYERKRKQSDWLRLVAETGE